ncbi:putative cytochrome P450 [Aspergillus karnatakaensis]|uniref:cytochrome P450 n=1 Tax=Aspergillus karnatakaensis TaxID=1810916 RepID=UPI003CCD4891
MLQSLSEALSSRLDATSFLLLLALAGPALALWCVVYNLYWHPLAGYSGPLLARTTPLYKPYVELVGRGCLVHKLEDLHAVYGDVVRIGPNELHYAAPSVYFEIYSSLRRWEKDGLFYRAFLTDNASFCLTRYKQANERKGAMNWLFSKNGIKNVHSRIESRVDELCRSFNRQSDSEIDLYYAFRCMSLDVIADICFGIPIDLLNSSESSSALVSGMDLAQDTFAGLKHSSLYRAISKYSSQALVRLFEPRMAGLMELQNPDCNGSPLIEKAIRDECQVLLFAGTDTTGTTLMRGFFHILKCQKIYAALKEELKHAWPEVGQRLSLSELERLPYLTAVIKESLRMNQGVVSPLPRVVQSPGALIGGRYVPANAVVGMSTHFVLQNETIFERPGEFRPERWLGDKAKDLDRWLVSFSKGPRSCLGINLAWAELYTCFAHVFRKFEIEINASSPESLVWIDRFIPVYQGPHVKATMRAMAL